MNKKELVSTIAKKANLSLSQAEAALAATFTTIQEVMTMQHSVAIGGFGNFTTKIRKERKGRNPSTGEELVIPTATVPSFKPASQLKESVNLSNTKES